MTTTSTKLRSLDIGRKKRARTNANNPPAKSSTQRQRELRERQKAFKNAAAIRVPSPIPEIPATNILHTLEPYTSYNNASAAFTMHLLPNTTQLFTNSKLPKPPAKSATQRNRELRERQKSLLNTAETRVPLPIPEIPSVHSPYTPEPPKSKNALLSAMHCMPNTTQQQSDLHFPKEMEPQAAFVKKCRNVIIKREKSASETINKQVAQLGNEPTIVIDRDDDASNRAIEMEAISEFIFRFWDDEDNEEQQSPQNDHVLAVSPETVFMCESLDRKATEKRARVGKHASYIKPQSSKKSKKAETSQHPMLQITNVRSLTNGAYLEKYEIDGESLPVFQFEEHLSPIASKNNEQHAMTAQCSIESDRKLRSSAFVILERCVLPSTNERGNPEVVSETVPDKKVRRDMAKKINNTENMKNPRVRKALEKREEVCNALTKFQKPQRAENASEEREKRYRARAKYESKQPAEETCKDREKLFKTCSERTRKQRANELTHEEREKSLKADAERVRNWRASLTPEQKEKRRKDRSDYARKQRVELTPEQKETRLKIRAEYKRKQRARETYEEREKRLKFLADYKRKRLAEENPEQREKRRLILVEKARIRQAREKPEQRERRRKAKRERTQRAVLTREEREKRNKIRAEYKRKQRARESPEEREKRLEALAEIVRKKREAETLEERDQRRAFLAERARKQRAAETPEQREKRLKTDAERRRTRRANESPDHKRERYLRKNEKRNLMRKQKKQMMLANN